MNTPLNEIQDLLGKPYKDLEFLLRCFSEVLIENGEEELASRMPWISGGSPDFTGQNSQKMLHLYSICFQLLNLSEVNGAVQNRRRKQETEGLGGVNGLWGATFSDLKKRGATAQQILEQFREV